MQTEIVIRPAGRGDAQMLLAMITALADFEKLPRPTAEAQARLIEHGFGPQRRFESYLAEIGGRAIGYALVFETYSSFLARPTLYLEDLFVLPEFRGRGAGKALFEFCLRETKRRDCGRMEWAVLDWNRTAIDFYQRYGAQELKEWLPFRLTAEQIEQWENAAGKT